MRKKIGYTIQGIATFVATFITVDIESEEELVKITDDELKEKIMQLSHFPKGKDKESITLHR